MRDYIITRIDATGKPRSRYYPATMPLTYRDAFVKLVAETIDKGERIVIVPFVETNMTHRKLRKKFHDWEKENENVA